MTRLAGHGNGLGKVRESCFVEVFARNLELETLEILRGLLGGTHMLSIYGTDEM